MSDDFFVGYREPMPPSIASFVRKWTLGLLLFSALLAAVLAAAQSGFAPGTFEFGTRRSFEGFVSESPYPTLILTRPHSLGVRGRFSRYLLVEPGKKGAADLVKGLDGRRVALDGTLVYRDAQTMIEVVPGSVRPIGMNRSALPSSSEDLGTHTLVGEIVDSKCFLGVMKPGNLKPHRSCAIRCISGGIPPVFVVRDASDHALYFVLTGSDGRTLNEKVLDVVAEPLEITGRVKRHDSLLLLKAEPKTFRRLN